MRPDDERTGGWVGGGEDGEGDVEGEGMGESSLDRTGDAEAGEGGEGGCWGRTWKCV